MTLRIFTHPACSGCGSAVEMGWKLSQEYDDLDLETVKLENKKGLAQAHEVGIKTIPTLIYYMQGEEKARLVGLPEESKLKEVFLELREIIK